MLFKNLLNKEEEARGLFSCFFFFVPLHSVMEFVDEALNLR